MPWLRTILSELFGLFVDDGSFAVAIVVWLGVAWMVLPRIATAWSGVMLFVGLAVILVESALRRARS